MALFQPTNIIPSSFTVGVVDANKDMAQVSWQVNGNSAMTAYQIDFYQNDTNSTYVMSTNKSLLSSGFYGTDRFGQPQMFTWNAMEKWNSYNTAFANGNQYKFKITQWYAGQDSVLRCEATKPLFSGFTYYFTNGEDIIVFSMPEYLLNVASVGYNIYYSYTTGKVWIDTGNRIFVCNGYRTAGSPPLSTEQVTGNIYKSTLNELFVSQIDPNIFIMRSTPSVNILRSDNNSFSNAFSFPNGSTLPASIGYFVGNYSQAQGAPVREVRWQVATWVNGNIGEILADTGNVNTPLLQYTFNGFFIGNEYAVRCLGKADYQTYGTQDFDSGWTHFTAQLPDGQEQGTYSGNFTVECIPRENSVLLQWEGIEVIPPTTSPDGFNPTTSNGSVMLPAKSGDTEYSIAWSEKGDDSINFTSPWVAVWKGNIKQTKLGISDFSTIQTVNNNNAGGSYLYKYTPDGKNLFAYEIQSREMLIYNVSSSGLSISGYLSANGVIWRIPLQYSSGYVNDFAFSKNGLFAVGLSSVIYLYSFVNGVMQYLDSTTVGFGAGANSLAFSPNGQYLAVGDGATSGSTTVKHRIYSVASNRLSLVCELPDMPNTSGSNNMSPAIDFNYDGTIICVGTRNGAYLCSFDGNQAKFFQELYSNEYTTDVVFSKNKNTDMLIILTFQSGYQYKVEDSKAQRIGILSDLGTVYQGITRSVEFSPDGEYLIVGGSGFVNYYLSTDSNLTFQGRIAPSDGSYWTNVIAVSWNPNPDTNQIIIYSETFSSGTTKSLYEIIQPVYSYSYYPQGKLLELQGSDIQLTAKDNVLTVSNGAGALANFTYPAETTETAIVVTPTNAYAYFYGETGYISQTSYSITYSQQSISSVEIFGGDSGATVDSVSIYQGNGSNVLSLYLNPDFEPVWNSEEYQLYMTANFNGNLEGGTGTSSGDGFRIYRQEVGSEILTPIANVPSTQTSLKDYGICSRKAYKYSLYAYDANSAFMESTENDTVVSTCFKNYSLLVCDYDSQNEAYHVRKQYVFALNLSAGSIGNNNSPTLNANFTAYPTRMPSTQNYTSGTLQGLIGTIYTVPALVEQIGGFKHTTKPSTRDYFDSVDLEKELYDLSVSPYTLFLRDMKGHIRMVATNNQISMTPDLKKRQIPLTISFPWVEIGDASDVTIIQTPRDYGWNNDNQVLDVRLDVDPTTGVLSATYPRPYNGTKFYLTGINKEILGAETPLGVTPAQFDLSAEAKEPDDGIVTVTAKVNTEAEED